MIHPGDVIREAERRQRERERSLAQHQARADTLSPRPRRRGPSLRDAYYLRLAGVGRWTCALGLALGCALETQALGRRRAAVKEVR
jgi:hypothetical protein